MTVAKVTERVASERSLDKVQARKVIEAVVKAATGGTEVTLPEFGSSDVQGPLLVGAAEQEHVAGRPERVGIRSQRPQRRASVFARMRNG